MLQAARLHTACTRSPSIQISIVLFSSYVVVQLDEQPMKDHVVGALARVANDCLSCIVSAEGDSKSGFGMKLVSAQQFFACICMVL